MARILYADDSGVSRILTAARLDRMNLDCVVVDDGIDAWALLEDGEIFDLIISDFEMPRMSGVDLLIKVRGDTRTAQIPFALFTGHESSHKVGDITLEVVCQELNATLIHKPCSNFSDIVTKLLE
ncbi:response regulator [Patescibacteria group bacterium]|nr:response regulator [Patescibacteria group bacterium]